MFCLHLLDHSSNTVDEYAHCLLNEHLVCLLQYLLSVKKDKLTSLEQLLITQGSRQTKEAWCGPLATPPGSVRRELHDCRGQV